jgi:hypothetical protein
MDGQTDRQTDDLISLLSFLESRLQINQKSTILIHTILNVELQH